MMTNSLVAVVAVVVERNNMPIKDPIKEKERKRLSGIKHREARNERRRQRYADDPEYREKINTNRKIYRENNLEKERARERNYKKENNDKVQAYKRNRYNTNTNYRIGQTLRSRLQKIIKNKSKSTAELLGCDMDFFLSYLEEKFIDDMSWENYGQWHIDHIRPCASFNLNDPEQQKECCHYTNLQPLWAKDNLSKGDRIIVNI